MGGYVSMSEHGKKKYTILDWFYMCIMPMCIFIMAVVTWYTSVEQNKERVILERQNAQSILSVQNNEFFLRKNEFSASERQLEVAFIRDAFKDCQNQGAMSLKKTEIYANYFFASEEKRALIMQKVKENCIADKEIISHENNQSSDNYYGLGLLSLKNKKFTEAVGLFSKATKITPSNVLLWNSLAYAQYRAGDFYDAMNSISVAIKIGSKDERVNSNIAINAAKILCAQGNVSGGKSYIQQAINVFPYLFNVVKRDGELLRVCSLTVPSDK